MSAPARPFASGRAGTVFATLEEFEAVAGPPTVAAPRDQWYNYNGHSLIDGAGKVSAEWEIDTPRGPISVHDFWWNPKGQLSIGLRGDARAMLWLRKGLAMRGIRCMRGTPREV
jgi:hypothetical protein